MVLFSYRFSSAGRAPVSKTGGRFKPCKRCHAPRHLCRGATIAAGSAYPAQNRRRKENRVTKPWFHTQKGVFHHETRRCENKIPGITDDQLDWLMQENGSDITREKSAANALQAQVDSLTAQVATAQDGLEGLRRAQARGFCRRPAADRPAAAADAGPGGRLCLRPCAGHRHPRQAGPQRQGGARALLTWTP